MKDVANRRHDTADWDGVFDRDGTVYWTGAPDRTRLVLTKYGLAASALFLGGPFVAAGGMQAAVSVIVTFFALRAFWLHLSRVSETRYAVSDRHIAIRRFGHGAGWLIFPLSDYFLRNPTDIAHGTNFRRRDGCDLRGRGHSNSRRSGNGPRHIPQAAGRGAPARPIARRGRLRPGQGIERPTAGTGSRRAIRDLTENGRTASRHRGASPKDGDDRAA